MTMEDDFKFTPNEGVGEVLFKFNKEQIIKKLGNPIEEKMDNELQSQMLEYELNGKFMLIFIHYEDSKFDYTSIHTDVLYMDDIEISTMNKDELLDFLKEYYEKLNLNFNFKYTEDDLDDYYEFDDIGLTVWFEEDVITDISVNPVWQD